MLAGLALGVRDYELPWFRPAALPALFATLPMDLPCARFCPLSDLAFAKMSLSDLAAGLHGHITRLDHTGLVLAGRRLDRPAWGGFEIRSTWGGLEIRPTRR